MSYAPANPLSCRRLVLLLASLLLGALVATLAMPAMFRAVPTDLSRIGVLLHALRDLELEPAIVIFGNSQAMCGVDARRLSAALPDEPLALNLSSTAQAPGESWLFYQELPHSVKTIVQLISPVALASDVEMSRQKFNAFYMYGYRADESTRRVLEESLGEPARELLDTSALAQVFQARWVLRQFVDTAFRRVLRRDLAIERSIRDLYFPQPYTQRIAPQKLDRMIGRMSSDGGESRIAASKSYLLKTMSRHAVAAGRRLVVVLPPLHPDARAVMGSGQFELVRDYLGSLADRGALSVVDATGLLADEHFVDAVHPTSEGAGILTARIALEIANTH